MSALPVRSASFVRLERAERRPAIDTRELTARLALDDCTKRDAYSVRYESYLSGGYIDSSPDGIFSDAHDALPNSQCMVIYKDKRPVASVRICVLDGAKPGWNNIPAANIFADEVETLQSAVREQGGRPARSIEINRLVRHPDFATDFTLVFALFRLATFMVYHYETDLMLSCVRRNHASFYRRLHFHHVAGPRRYPGVKFETNLMACYQPKYADVLRDVPIVDFGGPQSPLNAMFRGDTVAVFDGG